MKIVDGHCDVLAKMFLDPSIEFQYSQQLQANLNRLLAGDVKVQLFAIYVPEKIHPELKFNAALQMVDIFYEKIVKPHPQVKVIQSSEDLQGLQENEIGAVLTLEGCDAIYNDEVKLKTLLRLGVKSVGLTWNYGNFVADGVLEENAGGLSRFGKKVIEILNERNILCDVSHIAEKGFWDVMDIAKRPFASHSNCLHYCSHPRNLTDDQIRALIKKDGLIGLTFVREFLNEPHKASINDVLKHIDHICSLGGENHIGLGSDFDGTEPPLRGLEHAGEYQYLIDALLQHFPRDVVEKITYYNFKNVLCSR